MLRWLKLSEVRAGSDFCVPALCMITEYCSKICIRVSVAVLSVLVAVLSVGSVDLPDIVSETMRCTYLTLGPLFQGQGEGLRTSANCSCYSHKVCRFPVLTEHTSWGEHGRHQLPLCGEQGVQRCRDERGC